MNDEYLDTDIFGDTPFYSGILANKDLYSQAEISALTKDPAFADFKLANPQDAAILESFADNLVADENQSQAEVDRLRRQADLTASQQNAIANIGPQGNTGVQSQSADATGIKGLLDKAGTFIKDLTGISGSDAAKYAAMLALAKLAYDDAKAAREEAKGAKLDVAGVRAVRGADGGVSFRSAAQGGLMSMADDVDVFTTAQRVMTDPEYQRKFEGYLMEYLGQEQGYAEGGVARYFAGGTDGMADEIPANIENQRPAALSDGEFVIPADVVSHLGNGNSTAGAKRLYEMMDRIRHARTGTTKQGIEIDPNKFMLE